GLCVQWFGEDINSIQWEGVHFKGENGKLYLDLMDHLDPTSVAHCRSVLNAAKTPLDMIESMTVVK
ncbi:MAG: peptidase, partial [Nitrospirota bacterium]|nr:peptidase [Nitrospirota bacterium]